MKIGIFGGTFDPVHFGHIHLAVSLREMCQLDQVLFSPSWISPFKEESASMASALQRLEMLRLALEELSFCQVIDYEARKKGPSYTIDLVRYVKSLYRGEDELFLLLGEDLVSGFCKWKEYEQILSLASPLIGCRGRREKKIFENLPESFERGRVAIPILEISSTQVRERLKKKLYCGHLISGKVLEYIHENKLYLY